MKYNIVEIFYALWAKNEPVEIWLLKKIVAANWSDEKMQLEKWHPVNQVECQI